MHNTADNFIIRFIDCKEKTGWLTNDSYYLLQNQVYYKRVIWEI